jgi:PAS domain S-box-containing protein
MSEINVELLLAEEALKIVETLRDSLLLLDQNLQVVFANKSFYSTFKVTPEDTIGRKVYDIGNGQWNIPSLRVFIEETLSKEQEFNDYLVEHDFPHIGYRTMLVNGALVKRDHNLTLLIITDTTEREAAHNVLRDTIQSVEKMSKFIAGREVKVKQLEAEIENLKKKISEVLPDNTAKSNP